VCDPDFGLHCRERVGGDYGVAAGEGIEKGRFARIGQADKADTIHDIDRSSSTGRAEDHSDFVTSPDPRGQVRARVSSSALALSPKSGQTLLGVEQLR